MKKNKKKIIDTKSIENSRTGGAIAVTGFDYQCLYSMYVLLTRLKTNEDTIRFEGVEDIDLYMAEKENTTNHIQVKYSSTIQNASFLKDILKNFLEIHLTNDHEIERKYTLVYDFSISNGNFKKIINRKVGEKLTQSSESYWMNVMRKIQDENKDWNWKFFDFYDFLDKLYFENVFQTDLLDKVNIRLIEMFNITTGNELLYAHSLYHFSFTKMKNREKVDLIELRKRILLVSDEINKGTTNPSYRWLKKMSFSAPLKLNSSNFFEGKKAEISDIILELPIRRKNLEKNIMDSLNNYDITVIKAQSGQGKSTLAFQVIYDLRDRYSVYQLDWCNDKKEIEHFVQFIESRVKIGEVPLILIDNLNVEVSSWSALSKELSNRVQTNYKILVTSREDDWYFYGGDRSSLRNLNVIELSLNGTQAKEIYLQFKKNDALHPKINNWQSAWEMVRNKGLLIEFTFLLTHGEMLSTRLATQLSQFTKSDSSEIKMDILYKICFADTLDIPINIIKLSEWYQTNYKININTYLVEMDHEYFVKKNYGDQSFVGIHPVRSNHIIDILSYNFTPLKLIEIVDLIDNIYISKMYSKFPEIVYDEKEQFYSKLIEETKGKSYEYYLNALKGIFSGTIINYFNENRQAFDIVSVHGGLMPFTIEISPFSDFPEFDVKVDTLSQLRDVMPDNESLNIIYDLSKEIPKLEKMESDYFLYATYLSKYLRVNEMIRKKDFSTLNYWLVNVDTKFNLTNISITKEIWKNKKEWTIKDMSLIFLSCFIAEKERMTEFITKNRYDIFNYIITETDSIEIKEVNDRKDIAVKYILLPTDYDDANNESVKRLRLICEMLPIYEYYHSEAIRPKINFIEMLQLHDDSIKKIPQKNLVIMFHQFFNKIWLNTIQSNYESNTVYDWAMFWSSIRERIAVSLKKMIEFTELKVTNKKLSVKSSEKFLDTANSVLQDLKKNFFYPGEYHPFRENDDSASQEYKFRKEYFTNMQVVIERFANFLLNPDREKLWTFNLKKAAEELPNMQLDFKNIILAKEIGMENLDNLEMVESELIENLILTGSYFKENMSVKFISQTIIKKWYENQHSNRIKEIETSIESNGIEQIKFIYPKQIIEKNSLIYLPLVLIDSDILNDEYNGILLYSLTSLCEFQIDFIDILYLEVNGSSLNKRMMRINNTFLQKLKQAILTDDMSKVENLTPALPLAVDKSYLELYDFNFRIEMENGVYPDYDIIECEKLLLLFWKYSFIKNSNAEIKYGLEKHFKNQEEMLLIKIKDILIQMKNDNSTLLKLGEKTYDEIVKNDNMFLDTDLDNFYEYVGRMNLTDSN